MDEIHELQLTIEDRWIKGLSAAEKKSIWSKSAHERWPATQEHFRNQDLFQLWSLADQWIQSTKPDLTLSTLTFLHDKVSTEHEGRFRKIPSENNVIKFATPEIIESEMEGVLNNLTNWIPGIIPAAYFIQESLSIHPFINGNGRSLRLFLDLYFLKIGYPPPVYEKPSDLLVANSFLGPKQFLLEHAVLLVGTALERRLLLNCN